MAKIIAVINQKGGVGKTTIATNIASCLHADGGNVLLVDLDPQGSATDWSAQNENDDALPVVQMNKTLHRDLPRIARGYDFVVIDGAPQVSELAGTAIKTADVVLIPCTPSPYDVWSCSDLIDVIQARQDITEGQPKAAFVISMAIKHTKLTREVKDALADYGVPVFSNGTTRRVDYAETAKTGGSVMDLDDGNQAKFEITQICKELKAFING